MGDDWTRRHSHLGGLNVTLDAFGGRVCNFCGERETWRDITIGEGLQRLALRRRITTWLIRLGLIEERHE